MTKYFSSIAAQLNIIKHNLHQLNVTSGPFQTKQRKYIMKSSPENKNE